MFESPSNNVARLKACTFIQKEAPSQLFSCEYWEIFRKSFFTEHLPVHFPEFYVRIGIRYSRVAFYYCKIKPRNRKNLAVDRSKFPMKRLVFSQLSFLVNFVWSFKNSWKEKHLLAHLMSFLFQGKYFQFQ